MAPEPSPGGACLEAHFKQAAARAQSLADADPRGRVGLFEAAATSKLPASLPLRPPGHALVRRAHPGGEF